MKIKKNPSFLLVLAMFSLMAISCATPAVKKPNSNKPGSNSTSTSTQSQSGPKSNLYEEVSVMPQSSTRVIAIDSLTTTDTVTVKVD